MSNPSFDVTMGSYDGAESCDIIGLFMLSELKKLNLNVNLGLYRDDGLGVSNSTPRQIENCKKKICEVLKKHGLSITISANSKVVQFLDIEMDLQEGTYKPFIKPNDSPLYVHRLSNHPVSVTNNIPVAVNRRLSTLSSSQEMFNSVKEVFQEALEKSGYNHKLEYSPMTENPQASRKNNRRRQEIWFNPPHSTEVKTKIGAKFLRLIDQHFPKSNPLSKIFNRNTLKISYRCTPNLAKFISSHNAKILRQTENPVVDRACNCRQRANCPLDGNCLQKNLVYQATVSHDGGNEETYVGLTSNPFKSRHANHKKSFTYEKYETETELSKHVWNVKKKMARTMKKVNFNIKWKKLVTAKPFNPVTNICNLCTVEKYLIIFKPDLGTLNKRDEIRNHCRHKRGQLLDNT